MSTYRTLDPSKITATLEKLEQRIRERFPEAGLLRLAGEIAAVARRASGRVEVIERPILAYRAATGGLLVAGLALLLLLARSLDYNRIADTPYSVLQGIDAGFNIIVLIGAGLLFVWRLERAARRDAALKDLHELRSLIHVIDMHQLTKDPGMSTAPGPRTSSSPHRFMTPFELTRYLDYCSELLSLTAKIAALYAQSARDAVVISTVNDLEQLAANLSEKIWQKIGLVHGVDAGPERTAKPAVSPPVTAAQDKRSP